MGKLSYEARIQHFSHDHPLELSNLQNLTPNPTTSCSGCKAKPSGLAYACKACNYVLHISCSQMPQLVLHQAHQSHPLTLLARPAYPEGQFSCDACGKRGDGFCYHCATCSLDLHILCAAAPLVLLNPHHHHPLKLSSFPPYQAKGFSCDICHKLGGNHWLYRCNECEFDAHIGCATTERGDHVQVQSQIPMTQPVLHHGYSFPGANSPLFRSPVENSQQCYYVNGVSMGIPQTAQPVQNGAGIMYAVQPNYMGVAQSIQPPQNSLSGNSLMSAAIEGFVEGAAQQVGQNFVQSIIGASQSSG